MRFRAALLARALELGFPKKYSSTEGGKKRSEATGKVSKCFHLLNSFSMLVLKESYHHAKHVFPPFFPGVLTKWKNTVDGQRPRPHHEMKPWLKLLLVVICRGIESDTRVSEFGGAKWISISTIHSRALPFWLREELQVG